MGNCVSEPEYARLTAGNVYHGMLTPTPNLDAAEVKALPDIPCLFLLDLVDGVREKAKIEGRLYWPEEGGNAVTKCVGEVEDEQFHFEEKEFINVGEMTLGTRFEGECRAGELIGKFFKPEGKGDGEAGSFVFELVEDYEERVELRVKVDNVKSDYVAPQTRQSSIFA